jgi:predicted O-methyltransferase YrrM
MATTPTWQPPASLEAVKGWFFHKDQAVMTWLLDRQDRLEPHGDLLELGCYLGKSAIVVGTHLRPGETFIVCDLFDAGTEEAADGDNKSENRKSYASLTRQAFEANYLTFHEQLPTIVQSTTDRITEHVAPGSCRFVHIDASHLWQHVRSDIAAARTLLRPDGLVVCDDYRAEHTPGVAAAVWTAVAEGGLKPICITGNKFYGTWGDPGPVQRELADWLGSLHPGLPEWQTVLDHRIIRVCGWSKPPVPVVRPLRPVAEPDPEPVAPPAPRPKAHSVPKPSRWSSPKSIARELLPPVLTRALRRHRRRAGPTATVPVDPGRGR